MSYGTVTSQLCIGGLARQGSEFNSIALAETTVHGGSSVGLKFGVSQAASPLKTNVDVFSHQEIRIVSLLLSLVYVVFHPWGAPILVSAKSYP